MPRGVAAINRLWEELKAAKRAEEEASLARQEADALRAQWDDARPSPPASEPDSQAAPKPSYGLLDWIPTLWGDPEGYIRPRPAPVTPAPPLPQGVFDLLPAQWGGRPGDSPFASRPDPWTAAPAMMPPRLPAFEVPQSTLPAPRVPTAGGGPPAAIAGWSTGPLEGVPSQLLQWPNPSASLFPAVPQPMGAPVPPTSEAAAQRWWEAAVDRLSQPGPPAADRRVRVDEFVGMLQDNPFIADWLNRRANAGERVGMVKSDPAWMGGLIVPENRRSEFARILNAYRPDVKWEELIETYQVRRAPRPDWRDPRVPPPSGVPKYDAQGLPVAPPGVDINANIALARKNWYRPFWFYDQVKSGGPWDYKHRFGSHYEDFGNFHYGIVAKAFGFPDNVIYNEAGKAQYNGPTAEPTGQWGRPATRWSYIFPWADSGAYPYGDDPRDRRMISRGIRHYNDNYSGKARGKW